MGFLGNLFKLSDQAPTRGARMLGKMVESSQVFTPSGGMVSRSSAVNSAVGMSGTYGRAGKSMRQAGKMVNPNTGLPMKS